MLAVRPELTRNLLAAAGRSLFRVQEQMLLLGRMSATERLVWFLLHLEKQQNADGAATIHLPMSRLDIADYLGLTIETVSRVFRRLREQKIVAVEGAAAVRIVDPARIREIANGSHPNLAAARHTRAVAGAPAERGPEPMTRLVLILLAFTPLMAGAATLPDPPPPPPSHRMGTGQRAFRFRVAVTPLFDEEWWAATAAKCGFRSFAWLASVETAIDHDAGVAARQILGNDNAAIGESVRDFVRAQAKFRERALVGPERDCRVLESSNQIATLDHMVKRNGWRAPLVGSNSSVHWKAAYADD